MTTNHLHDDKKAITLININAPYELKPSTLVLASEDRTSTVLQILVYPHEIVIRDLLLPQDDAAYERKLPTSSTSFQEVFQLSHTVIIPDSMLCEKSRVFETEAFTEHALSALKEFYDCHHGTVLVQCVEGAFGTNIKLKELFGVDWKINLLDSKTVIPNHDSLAAKTILGHFAPTSVHLKDTPFFISTANNNDGLYKVPLMNFEEFTQDFRDQDEAFERLGIEKDESLTCFNLEKSWENYLEKYTRQFLIAVTTTTTTSTRSSTKGHLVWYGDRGNSENLAYVFCKLLNLRHPTTTMIPTTKTTTTSWSHVLESHVVDYFWTIMCSCWVVLGAVAVQLYLIRYK